jgi:hypothetical protein
VDCYLYHICSVGTRRVHYSDATRDNDWGLLKAHLLTIYPPTTAVHLIGSPLRTGTAGTRVSATVESLDDLFPHVHFDTTLFIEGTRPRLVDRAFLRRIATPSVQP